MNGLCVGNEQQKSHINIWHAEGKIITVVQTIAEIFTEIMSQFPGTFQTNSAKFTIETAEHIFFYVQIYLEH